jgi:hypothetical protein
MNRRGFSLTEALIYGGLATWIGVAAARYIRLPGELNKMMNTVNNEQTGYSATVIPVDDLKSALGSSIQWNLIDTAQPSPPYNPEVMPWFQVNDLSADTSVLPLSYVCYWYRESDGALVREFIRGGPPLNSPIDACAPVVGDNAEQKVIVKGMLPPTAAMPLFRKDGAASNMVVITLRFRGTGPKPLTVVRRIYMRS